MPTEHFRFEPKKSIEQLRLTRRFGPRRSVPNTLGPSPQYLSQRTLPRLASDSRLSWSESRKLKGWLLVLRTLEALGQDQPIHHRTNFRSVSFCSSSYHAAYCAASTKHRIHHELLCTACHSRVPIGSLHPSGQKFNLNS